MKRSPLKRQRKPLPFKSKKRKAETPERAAVIAACIVRDNNECQARDRVPFVPCGFPPDVDWLDCHEIIPRSAWKAGYLNVDNCLMVCRWHHHWIDSNPDAAAMVGLHGYSWQRPKEAS